MAWAEHLRHDVEVFVHALSQQAHQREQAHLSENACREAWHSFRMPLLHHCRDRNSSDEHMQALFDAALSQLPPPSSNPPLAEASIFTLFACYASQIDIADSRPSPIPIVVSITTLRNLESTLPFCNEYARQCVAHIRSNGDFVPCAADRIARRRSTSTKQRSSTNELLRHGPLSKQMDAYEGPLVQASAEVDAVQTDTMPMAKVLQRLMTEEEMASVKAFGKAQSAPREGMSDAAAMLENVVHTNMRRARTLADEQLSQPEPQPERRSQNRKGRTRRSHVLAKERRAKQLKEQQPQEGQEGSARGAGEDDGEEEGGEESDESDGGENAEGEDGSAQDGSGS
jgi:hypothetical protein